MFLWDFGNLQVSNHRHVALCQDFHKFGEALEPVIEKGGICVVGSAESCDKAKEKYGLSLTSPFAEDVLDVGCS